MHNAIYVWMSMKILPAVILPQTIDAALSLLIGLQATVPVCLCHLRSTASAFIS